MNQEQPKDDYNLTVKEAANKLSISKNAVFKLIARGRLAYVRSHSIFNNYEYRLSESSVDEWARIRERALERNFPESNQTKNPSTNPPINQPTNLSTHPPIHQEKPAQEGPSLLETIKQAFNPVIDLFNKEKDEYRNKYENEVIAHTETKLQHVRLQERFAGLREKNVALTRIVFKEADAREAILALFGLEKEETIDKEVKPEPLPITVEAKVPVPEVRLSAINQAPEEESSVDIQTPEPQNPGVDKNEEDPKTSPKNDFQSNLNQPADTSEEGPADIFHAKNQDI